MNHCNEVSVIIWESGGTVRYNGLPGVADFLFKKMYREMMSEDDRTQLRAEWISSQQKSGDGSTVPGYHEDTVDTRFF